jgi:hypothetical protein
VVECLVPPAVRPGRSLVLVVECLVPPAVRPGGSLVLLVKSLNQPGKERPPQADRPSMIRLDWSACRMDCTTEAGSIAP